jgi:hypothetical protein
VAIVSIRPHQAADGGAFLGDADEDLAGLAVLVQPGGDVTLVAGDVELVRQRPAGVREPAAQGALDDPLDDLLDRVNGGRREVVARDFRSAI